MEDLYSLKTPSLVLDADRVRRNARRISNIAAGNGVDLRPHIKTHKCVEVARIQTEGHFGGITASTLAEVRAFAANGFNDITYAVPIEIGKFLETVEIVRRGVKLNLITDDLETVRLLDDAAWNSDVEFDVFLKVDSGYHRCGVEPHDPAALEISRALADARNLRFAGILTHAGHSYHGGSKEEIASIAARERDVMSQFATLLRGTDIDVPTVSIGSTPTITHIDHLRGIDEIRPGNYVFFDTTQATLGSCGFADCALSVLSAVTHVSRTHKKVVIDAGAIAISKDRGAIDLDASCGYGRVLDLEGNDLGLRLNSLSQEHGEMQVDDDTVFDKLTVGSRVRILANHSCLTAAQHSHYNVLEGDKIADRWQIHLGW